LGLPTSISVRGVNLLTSDSGPLGGLIESSLLPGATTGSAETLLALFRCLRSTNCSRANFKGVSLNYRPTIPASISHMPGPIEGNGSDRLFRAAARHSRHVRFLRYSIPVGIVAIASIIFIPLIPSFLDPFRLIRTFPIDPGRVSVSGTKIVMELPRVHGFTTDSRPYALTARVAMQDITQRDILELKEVEAQIELNDGQHVTIESTNGTYNTKGEVLKLNDHVVLHSTSGYDGYLSEATVYVTIGKVVSESPVEIKLPSNGLLNANRLEVVQNGSLVIFGGGVEMTINPDQLQPAPQEALSASAPAEVSIQRSRLNLPCRLGVILAGPADQKTAAKGEVALCRDIILIHSAAANGFVHGLRRRRHLCR
jgi:lipopolysaccharide export system protein LptC